MKLKKVFCLFLSVMMIITAFSAVAVSANAENGMPDAAFTGGQPPEKPDGEMPGEPPEGMGGPGGGMGTPPDGAPGGGGVRRGGDLRRQQRGREGRGLPHPFGHG